MARHCNTEMPQQSSLSYKKLASTQFFATSGTNFRIFVTFRELFSRSRKESSSPQHWTWYKRSGFITNPQRGKNRRSLFSYFQHNRENFFNFKFSHRSTKQPQPSRHFSSLVTTVQEICEIFGAGWLGFDLSQGWSKRGQEQASIS